MPRWAMTEHTRRSVLKLAGASLAAATVPAATHASDTDDWTAVRVPVDTTLHDVADTATVPHAVGGAGVLVERTAAGWELVFDGGPTGNGNDLFGVDVTDDGERLWLVGASGAIGEYDVETGNLVDRSAPNDHTGNFNDVAVTGPAGDAGVYVADDSGAIHYSFENGKTGTWEYAVPGSGDSLNAIEFHGDRAGHVIAEGGNVFATDDGTTWNRIGIEDTNASFYGLDADTADDVVVSGGNATIQSYNGNQWRPESLGDADLKDVETDCDDGYAVGSGGTIFEQDGGTWTQNTTPVGENLMAVSRESIDIAVGSGGTILER